MTHPFHIVRLGINEVTSFRELIALFDTVFENKQPQEMAISYHKALLTNPYFIVFAAMNGQTVIGGLTAYELPSYTRQGAELFIYDIAVHPAHRRKGVGEELIKEAISYCREQHIGEMFVSADSGDDDALSFYRSTAGKEAPVVHFSYRTDL